MPPISVFQRRQLASQVVGTVLEDGDAQLAGAVAGAATGLAKTLVGIERQRAEQQQRVRAQEKKRSAAINEAAVGRAGVQLDAEFDPITRSAKDSSEFLRTTDQIIENQAGRFQDPQAQSLFRKKAVGVQQRSLDLFQTRSHARDVEQIETTTNGTIEDVAASTGAVFATPGVSLDDKLGQFANSLALAGEAIDTASQHLSPAAIREFREDSTQAITQAAVVGLLDGGPEDVDSFLDDVVESGVLTREEEADVRSSAAAIVAKRQAFSKIQQQRVVQKTETDFVEKALAGELDTVAVAIAKTQGTISEGFDKDLMDVFTSSEADKAITKPATVLDLTNEIMSLPFDNRKKVVKPETTTLGELALIRQKILRAHSEGSITATDGKNLMSMITPAFNEEISAVVEDLNRKAVAGSAIWASPIDRFTGSVGPVERWLSTPDEINQARAAMSTLFMQRIAQTEAANGRRVTIQEAHQISKNIRDDFLLSVESDKATLELGQITHHPTFGFVRVVGFFENGEAMLDDDLSASVQKLDAKKQEAQLKQTDGNSKR